MVTRAAFSISGNGDGANYPSPTPSSRFSSRKFLFVSCSYPCKGCISGTLFDKVSPHNGRPLLPAVYAVLHLTLCP